VLPNSARIKSSSDFARATKSGRRVSSDSLIGYLYSSNSSDPAKLGLIVGKSVGNSVVRHRIARQIRHAVREDLNNLPNGTLFVVRAMKKPENAFHETESLLVKVLEKVNA
jgi:ribonuclease P protein component